MNMNMGKTKAGLNCWNSVTKKLMSINITYGIIPVHIPCPKIANLNFQSIVLVYGNACAILESRMLV